MKVEITKQVKIYNCIAFLELSYLIQREDIKDFLNGKRYDDESINKKIEEYLKKVKILDEYGSPTKYGEKIKETGKVYENQVGKFKVWYTLNDSMLENTILGLKREYSRDNNAIKSDQIVISRLENSLLSINANDKQKYFLSGDIKLKNKSIANYSSCNDKLNPITLEKEWEDLDSLAKTSFRGSINDGNVSYSISNKKYEDRDNLEDWLRRYEDGNWDLENKLFLVDFKTVKDNERTSFIRSFEKEWYLSKNDIVKVKFSNASIAPQTQSDAQNWLDWLIEEKLKENYISSGDLQQYTNEIVSRKEFSKYANLKPNLPKKKSDKIAYWHNKACEDLCQINTNNDYVKSVITFVETETISITKIIKELGLDKINYDSVIVYYDKYACKTWWSKKYFETFLQCINCKIKIIACDLSEDKLENNYIKCVDYKKQHDRYIIIGNKKGSIDYLWNVSQSSGFAHISKEFSKETKFNPKNNVTFSMLDNKKCPKELLDIYNNQF